MVQVSWVEVRIRDRRHERLDRHLTDELLGVVDRGLWAAVPSRVCGLGSGRLADPLVGELLGRGVVQRAASEAVLMGDERRDRGCGNLVELLVEEVQLLGLGVVHVGRKVGWHDGLLVLSVVHSVHVVHVCGHDERSSVVRGKRSR